jgi:hypothetical protein
MSSCISTTSKSAAEIASLLGGPFMAHTIEVWGTNAQSAGFFRAFPATRSDPP